MLVHTDADATCCLLVLLAGAAGVAARCLVSAAGGVHDSRCAAPARGTRVWIHTTAAIDTQLNVQEWSWVCKALGL